MAMVLGNGLILHSWTFACLVPNRMDEVPSTLLYVEDTTPNMEKLVLHTYNVLGHILRFEYS